MKIRYHIITYISLAACMLLFSMPLLRPACKRMMHQISATAGKHQVPADDMEAPVSCGVGGIAIEPGTMEYGPAPIVLILKKHYPLAKTRFPADPFPECIDAPPRGGPAAI